MVSAALFVCAEARPAQTIKARKARACFIGAPCEELPFVPCRPMPGRWAVFFQRFKLASLYPVHFYIFNFSLLIFNWLMSWAYRTLLRPWLFRQDSETIHNRTIRALARVSRSPAACQAMASFRAPEELPVQLFGLKFPNPVGLAAGMDKEAAAVPAWAAMGFGFSELGGVTWHGQPGNDRPRVFRAIPDEALINRMGFNNPGAEAIALQLAEWKSSGFWPAHPVGINLGKSKITPLTEAATDYSNSLRALWPHADFFVVNVSSPNTPNLRQLQDKSALDEILAALQEVNSQSAGASA